MAERMYRFGAIEYLRATPQATATYTFEALISYDEVYAGDLESFPASGPALRPDGRYVIFAVPDRQDLGLPADWYINLACELKETDRPGAMR